MHDLRAMLRWERGARAAADGRHSRRAHLQSTPESGHRAGYDGHKRRKGSKIHLAVDTLGHLLALHRHPGQRPGARPGRGAGRGGAGGDRADVWKWASSIRATPGEQAAAARPRTASSWRWSSCRRPSTASSCCRAAGSSSAPSPGRRASAAWPAITNACPRWRGLHFLAFACLMLHRLVPSREVHNTLFEQWFPQPDSVLARPIIVRTIWKLKLGARSRQKHKSQSGMEGNRAAVRRSRDG